ncbi:MAG: hypothetical protein AMXMBFR44_2060 [Candidatus Campbellbacteria bacterium]
MEDADVGRKVCCVKRDGDKVQGTVCKCTRRGIGVKTPHRFYPSEQFSEFFRALEYLTPRLAPAEL